jgi:hypothetical protein
MRKGGISVFVLWQVFSKGIFNAKVLFINKKAVPVFKTSLIGSKNVHKEKN